MEPFSAAPPSFPFFLFFDPEQAGSLERKSKQRVSIKPKRASKLLCAACKHRVTAEEERIDVQGAHYHVCTNPLGVVYDIACFRSAEGCLPIGDATMEFTWFSGYTWRIAMCAKCQNHLGWRFESGTDSFYGLIRSQLIAAPSTNSGD